MKKVYIIHGWDGSPEEPMLVWLKNKLEEKGFQVFCPIMPETAKPKIEKWIKKLNEIVKNPDKNSYFVGHSIGCQAVLRYLSQVNPEVKIGGVVLIAPWMELDENTLEEEGEEVREIARPWMETPIDWNKIKITTQQAVGIFKPQTETDRSIDSVRAIKKHTDKFVCILSDNDSYVPLSNAELFKEKLNAKIIIEHDKGHYTAGDNVKENRTVVEELMKMVI